MADVKVRLSVEGAPEAIAAMRAFSAQSHAAGKQAEDGFSGLAKGLEGVRGLLGGLGVALTVGEFVKFTKETISLAVEQKHLAQQIGTTVEHMSALSYAATLSVPVPVLIARLVFPCKLLALDTVTESLPSMTVVLMASPEP